MSNADQGAVDSHLLTSSPAASLCISCVSSSATGSIGVVQQKFLLQASLRPVKHPATPRPAKVC